MKAPLEALAEALAKDFGTPKFFRPYRDVRFSKDKTPYKTHQGVWFGEASMYLHIGAAGLFVAGGYWDTEFRAGRSAAPGGRRRRPGQRPGRGDHAVERKGFEIGGHQLSRVPSGYDKDHPRATSCATRR